MCYKEILSDEPHAYRYYCKKTGYFYGFKHGECKGRKNQLTVLFHNGAKFDFRLIITYLAEKCFDSNISYIFNSMETFLTFSINNFDNTSITLTFVDSYRHLTYPLADLVKSLLNKETDINLIKNIFPSLFQYFDDKSLKLLRKGVYPYNHMDEDWKNKLKEKELRDIKYFHSSLTNTKCSSSDYSYAKETYNYFNCKNIKNYTDLCVQTDVFLLADELASYRKNSFISFKLDSLYCISAPGFSNRAMLKMAKAETELITDPNIHLIMKKGIRGGRCEPIYYHAKANNKYVNPNFDEKRNKESHIISFGVNSLYSLAMTYKLPYGESKFDNDLSKYTINHILNLDSNGEYCYVFNVDLHYPRKLHDRDFEFPLLCDHSISPGENTIKLMATYYDKENYSISLLNLKYCLEKGMKLRKTHHVIYAKQSNFMKPYINFNNEK